jgi:hypothetical protein
MHTARQKSKGRLYEHNGRKSEQTIDKEDGSVRVRHVGNAGACGVVTHFRLSGPAVSSEALRNRGKFNEPES